MDFLQKLTKAFWISRPIFWIGPLAAYKAGLWAAGIPMGPLQWLEVFIFAFPASFLIYGLNDIYDREQDRNSSRKSSRVWGEKIREEDVPWVKNWCIAAALGMALVGIATLNPIHALLAFSGIAFAYAYSAPPIRLKEKPPLDSLTSACYVFIPFGLAYTLGGSLDFLDWRFGLLCLNVSALHAIAAVADMDDDRKEGVRTIASAFGGRFAALFAALIFSLNFLMVFLNSGISPDMALVAEAAALPCILLCLWLAAFPAQRNGKTALKLLIAYGMLWGYFLVLHYFVFGRHFMQDEFVRAVPRLLSGN